MIEHCDCGLPITVGFTFVGAVLLVFASPSSRALAWPAVLVRLAACALLTAGCALLATAQPSFGGWFLVAWLAGACLANHRQPTDAATDCVAAIALVAQLGLDATRPQLGDIAFVVVFACLRTAAFHANPFPRAFARRSHA